MTPYEIGELIKSALLDSEEIKQTITVRTFEEIARIIDKVVGETK